MEEEGINLIKDIQRYGVRNYTFELDVNIHQFIYSYNNKNYILTMKNGEYISVFELGKRGYSDGRCVI